MDKSDLNKTIFMQVFDMVDIGLVVLDKELRVRHWNRWMQLHSGIYPDKIVGALIYDIFRKFKTNIELAIEMLGRAHERGHLLFQWVSGDCAYGDAHEFRKHIAEMGKWYCFEVYCDTHVWTDDPGWKVPPATENRRGRKAKLPKPTIESPPAVSASSLVSSIPDNQWQRICLREGDKGPREFEFARLRVFEKWDGKPGPASWLMLRRSLGPGEKEIKFYLSSAPETVSISEMAWAGCQRWSIEVDFNLAKGEVGIDHYELTKYRGWYHHITLSLLALAFLKSVQQQWGKKMCVGYSS